jgi:KTSC domain
MKTIAVDSAALQAIAWRHGQMEITFESGHLYRYFGVPRPIFDELLRAESKGRYFHDRIRDRYRFRRLR